MALLTRTRASAVSVGALALLAGLIAPAAAHAAVAEDPIRLETGHIDAFNLVLNDDGSPGLVLKEDVTGSHVLRTPESVELFVKPAAQQQVPADYVPGLPSSVYFLPLTQDHSLIWPGWDTQALTPEFGAGFSTDFTVDVEGPGQVFLWSQDSFGAPKPLMHGDDYALPGVISQPYPAHTHANWAFTDPGTYKLTVQGEVASADGAKTATTNTATYTFVVAERTKLTPAAPTQSGNTVTIPAQPWTVYTDGSGAVLEAGPHELREDLTITAAPAYGFDLADGAPSEWSFDAQAPQAPALSITGLRGHYHQNTPIELEAASDPAAENAGYAWFIQRTDQPEPVRVAGVTEAQLRITAEQALNGARVSAQLLDEHGEAVASAEPVTIEVDDHGADPLQRVVISGLAGHYHPGDTATLTAGVEPASVLTRYDWFVQRDAETEPSPLQGEVSQNGAAVSFEATEALDGASIFAQLSYDDGERYVVSEPVTLHVEDHGGEHPAPKPDTAPTAQTGAALDGVEAGGITASDTKPSPGETVTVQIGEGDEFAGRWVAVWMFSDPVLLGGDWQAVAGNGSVSVTIPADAPAGGHRLAAFAEDGSLIGWQAIEVAAAGPGGGTPGGGKPGEGTPGATAPGGQAPAAQTPAGANAPAGGAKLSTTGTELAAAATAATLLLAAGVGAVLLARRRTPDAPGD
ncbi:choice-of-anchor M domain-containing protein [Leucobacter muris]|nr:choice-of-anchor M domain-containing protein [Leucobacter muris]